MIEVKERLRAMRNATYVQLGIATASLGFGAITGNLAYTGEALHSGSDSATHGIRYFIEKKGWNQEGRAVKAVLKGSLLIPAGLIGYTAYKAGVDVINHDYPGRHPITNIVGATAIYKANKYAHGELHSLEHQSNASSTSLAHALGDKWFSLATAGGLVAEAVVGHGVSNVVTCAVGVAAAGYMVNEARNI